MEDRPHAMCLFELYSYTTFIQSLDSQTYLIIDEKTVSSSSTQEALLEIQHLKYYP